MKNDNYDICTCSSNKLLLLQFYKISVSLFIEKVFRDFSEMSFSFHSRKWFALAWFYALCMLIFSKLQCTVSKWEKLLEKVQSSSVTAFFQLPFLKIIKYNDIANFAQNLSLPFLTISWLITNTIFLIIVLGRVLYLFVPGASMD